MAVGVIVGMATGGTALAGTGAATLGGADMAGAACVDGTIGLGAVGDRIPIIPTVTGAAGVGTTAKRALINFVSGIKARSHAVLKSAIACSRLSA